MPIAIHDLSPGDRVVLNCPKARVMQKREAQFEGVFRSFTEAAPASTHSVTISEPSPSYVARGVSGWARFLMGRVGRADIIGVFAVEPDGGLREDEGRRVFVERRLERPAFG